MKKLISLSALLILLALPGCGRTMAVENVESAPLGGTESMTMKQVKKGIVRAGARRDWVISEVKPGHLVGEITVRGKHSATVDIYYDTEVFSIFYRDSENLKYDGQNIHKNYVHWVRNLKKDIQMEMRVLGVSWSPFAPSGTADLAVKAGPRAD